MKSNTDTWVMILVHASLLSLVLFVTACSAPVRISEAEVRWQYEMVVESCLAQVAQEMWDSNYADMNRIERAEAEATKLETIRVYRNFLYLRHRDFIEASWREQGPLLMQQPLLDTRIEMMEVYKTLCVAMVRT